MNPEAGVWDAVIVGTGIGGATLGLALARAGRRILFVERGLQLRDPASGAIFDRFVEDSPEYRKLSPVSRELRIARGGRSTDRIADENAPSVSEFHPYIGSGAGGSSALYGMVMERLFPIDFEHDAAWPLHYDELRPWYEAAERLYRVRGGADPLRPGEDSALLPVPPLAPEEVGS